MNPLADHSAAIAAALHRLRRRSDPQYRTPLDEDDRCGKVDALNVDSCRHKYGHSGPHSWQPIPMEADANDRNV